MLRHRSTSLAVILMVAGLYLSTPMMSAQAQTALPDTTVCAISAMSPSEIAAMNAAAPSSLQGGNPGAVLRFPNRGQINALHIFVQFEADSVASSPAQDLQTEWPVGLSLGAGNPLPTWADDMLADPGTDPSNYAEGSLSEYYHLMSDGRFKLEGYVYPQVYIPDHDPDWYTDTTSAGDFANVGGFANPSIALSHEILSHVAANPQGIPFDELDRWRNGTPDATLPDGDGIIDMIIISRRSTLGNGAYFREITSFGSCHPSPASSPCLGSNQDAFSSAPIFFGTKQVIDNAYNGSGVIASSRSVTGIADIVAHEIGHRQFGLYHVSGSRRDIFSKMNGWPAGNLSPMSLGDRLKLDWVTLDTLDIATLSHQTISLDDTFEGGRALYIKEGDPRQGDVYIEARTQSNFWDRAPDGTNYDFDDNAIYLEESGLMVYKRNSSGSSFSTMERTRLPERESYWELTQCCFPNEGAPVFFTPGSMLSPFSVYRFSFNTSSDIDNLFAITDIEETTSGYSFDIWGDYPGITSQGTKVVTEVSSFANTSGIRNLAYEREWTLDGHFVFKDSLYAAPATTSSNTYPNIISLEQGTRLEAFSLLADGTPTDTVLFTQASPGERWDRIVLRDGTGSSHSLDHVRIEGGTVGLNVRARNSTADPRLYGAYVTNTQLVNNGLGVLTDYAQGDDPNARVKRSSVSFGQVLVENSLTHGFYFRNTDAAIGGSTVRNNGRHGAVVTNATIDGFVENVIESNGPASSSYDGLRVGVNGYVDFSWRGDVIGVPSAKNRLADNADHQVVLLDGGYLVMGVDGFGGGRNTITESGSGCRVSNESTGTLFAENNFWGTTTAPPTTYFCGAFVSANPFITADSTSASGGGYRVAPGHTPLAAYSTPAHRNPLSGSTTGWRGGVGGGYTTEDLAAEIVATRNLIEADSGTPEAAGLVRHLGALHRLDEDDVTGELGASSVLLANLRQGLGGALAADPQATAEQALLVEVEFALAAQNYDVADALVVNSGPLVFGEEESRTLEVNAVAVDEALGRYNEALGRLDVLLTEATDEELIEDLEFLAEQVAAKAGSGASSRGTGSAASATSRTTTSPTVFALGAAYPNPASRETTIPLDLSASAEVRVVVYDLLGREVAILVEGTHEAGRHKIEFETSRLSSGVYVIRAEIAPTAGEVRAFTQKLTLVR